MQLPELLASAFEQSRPECPLRVWCAGSADGQEPYSLLMALAERFGLEAMERVLIFVGDVHEPGLARTRQAQYSSRELDTVPERMRARYFEREGTAWKLIPQLRWRAVVSRHDLLRDPPYSRVDLILCRNTLIYFTPTACRRLLHAFHYVLRDCGLLALGGLFSTDRFRGSPRQVSLQRRSALSVVSTRARPRARPRS
jgi:two-component system, chemotaxis family, CheB/CheR fusion protein